jgi:hypothetical protein
MEENQVSQVQEQTAEVTTQPEQAKVSQPFKVFSNEDEYKKEIQSVSSKAKYELLKELGAKNLDDVRIKFSELEATKAELTEYAKIKQEFEALTAEKQKISEDLVLTKMNVTESLKNEALTLAKAKLQEHEGSLEKAMEDVIKKFPSMVNNNGATPAPSKIGTPKTSGAVNMTDPERDRLMKRYPHLKNKI